MDDLAGLSQDPWGPGEMSPFVIFDMAPLLFTIYM